MELNEENKAEIRTALTKIRFIAEELKNYCKILDRSVFDVLKEIDRK